MSGKNVGGSTGRNVSGGGGGIDRNALQDIRIVNGELIVTKRNGIQTNLGRTVAQELITFTATVPIGDGEYEITHNLGTKNIIYQVFNSTDEVVEVPSIRYENKIKLFFGTTDSETTYTVVISQ